MDDADVLTICAPAGFDDFQKETGIPVDSGNGPFPESPDSGAAMQDAAPKYGIELNPDKARFDSPPDIVVRSPEEGEIIAVVGDVYRFLVRGEDTGGAYSCWHATIYPGGGPPPHLHNREEEFFFILSGKVSIFDDGEKTVATPGTAVVLPAGTRHWFQNEGSEPIERG